MVEARHDADDMLQDCALLEQVTMTEVRKF